MHRHHALPATYKDSVNHLDINLIHNRGSKIISFEKEQIMSEQILSSRVLNRMGARELTSEEVQHIAGGTTGCHGTSLHKNGPIVDVACDPS